MTFESLGLSPSILKAIDKKGYKTPSPIQEKAIPHIIKKKDVLASAQTGTGKTAGFTLPILHLLNEKKTSGRREIKALILTPTRELAAQIYENVQEYSEFTSITSMVIFGGVGQNPQVQKLKKGVDVLIATPGRLLDLEGQGALSLKSVEVLVLDEADRMLDMGFARDIQKVLKLVPEKRQNLLFSATFSKEIKKMAHNVLVNPVSVEAAPENTTAEKVEQKAIKVDQTAKTDLLIKLIKDGEWEQVLVFTRTKHRADRLSKKLDKNKISSAPIHGNKSQGARTKALAGFKDGSVRVLVATDIAARGLDIPLLPRVINFELPNVPEDYVHRIGRTGRAGASGQAISLVCSDEEEYVKGIEKLLGQKLVTQVVSGFEPSSVPQETKQNNKPKKTVSKSNKNRRFNSRK